MSELTIKEVLDWGIAKEIESRLLYVDLVNHVREPAAKDAFKELAEQERAHQTWLESYRKGELTGGALSGTQTLDYRIAEYFKQPSLSPDMKLQDTFLLAASREKVSHDLYTSLAGVHPQGEVRTMLALMAAQELEHKHRVELLYTEVAFPQTDGG